MLYRNHNEYHLKHYTGVWNIITIFVYQDQQMRQQTVSAGQISLFRFFHIE